MVADETCTVTPGCGATAGAAFGSGSCAAGFASTGVCSASGFAGTAAGAPAAGSAAAICAPSPLMLKPCSSLTMGSSNARSVLSATTSSTAISKSRPICVSARSVSTFCG